MKGRCIRGPKKDIKRFIATWIFLIGVHVLYFGIVVRYLWGNVVLRSFVYFTTVMTVLSVLFYFLCSWSDPGIIPRQALLLALNHGNIPKGLDKPPENQKNKAKFCETCNIWRPPRSSHCRRCDCCVEVFDHHCPYLNNCIGKRNHRYFIGFLFFLSLDIFCVILSSFIYIFQEIFFPGKTFIPVKVIQMLVIFMTIFLLSLVMSMVFGLLLFHFYLSWKGKTTKERLMHAR